MTSRGEPDAGGADTDLASAVLSILRRRGETLAVAESLTGGLLAAALVDVPGASDVFRGGLVVYATQLKQAWAGVPGELLAERGPVDPDVAVALARGARGRAEADWGLATTGVAGPDAVGSHPVGDVWVGVAGAGVEEAARLRLEGDRAVIRRAAVTGALRLLKVALASIEK